MKVLCIGHATYDVVIPIENYPIENTKNRVDNSICCGGGPSANAAYLLALLVRFYVNFEFRPTVTYYLTAFWQFAPFYTIICILVFFLFKLYGGMWRYAGLNDINRIAGASVVTFIFQIIGTLLFVQRMPLTFYSIGGALQFLFVAAIRFAYRIIIVERNRISKKKADALVIGSGEEAHYILRLLNNGLIYRPLCVVDHNNTGRMMDGLPVYAMLVDALDKHRVDCVFLADSQMSNKEKEAVHALCEKKNITIRDYTSFFTYTGEEGSFYDAREVLQDADDSKHFISFMVNIVKLIMK